MPKKKGVPSPLSTDRKLSFKISERKNPSGSISYRIHLGDYKFRQFRYRKDAVQFVEELKDAQSYDDREEIRSLGRLLKSKFALIECQEKLDTWGIDWKDVFNFYEEHGASNRDINITIKQGVDIFCEHKRRDRFVSKEYLRHLQVFSFRHLKEHFGEETLLKTISRQKFESYLRSLKVGVVSKNHIITTTKTLFSVLVEQGHLGINPIEKIKHIPLPRKLNHYQILKNSEVRSILNQAVKDQEFEVLTVLVLVLFCGVRIGEAMKMKWEDIRYYDKSVDVTEGVSKKTGHLRPRNPPIPDNAMCWLRFNTFTRKKRFRINTKSASFFQTRLRRTIKRSGVAKIEKNVLRHTFASYSVNFHGLTETAERMGHYRSTQVLKDYYASRTTRIEAKRYVDLYPKVSDIPDHLSEKFRPLVLEDLAKRKTKT